MDTLGLKKFASQARTDLIAQVGSRLDYVLGSDAVELRDRANDIETIKSEISKTSREALIERVAYLWFNRMTALRYMDANRYTDIGIVSPAPNQSQPEILAEAKTGSIDPGFASDLNKAEILSLLAGQTNATDPEGVAYRKLFLGACNHFGQTMSFMFESIADWTELLLPDDLLSDHSILSQMRDVMTEEVCEDVEVIGWLYQFYISEKKDEVFAGLKKNTKITPENIPAATQLFTPNWIVRYLVENSLGRLWMLNNPESGLIHQMEHYITPEEVGADYLHIASPQDIKICDPACGSGHILTYAFDLLYSIYEESGYDLADIPSNILANNLFGIEIDERAGGLAAFALVMKARDKQRGFLDAGILPNICVLKNVDFKESELEEYMTEVGTDLFTAELRQTLTQFKSAKNYGSLIVPALQNTSEVTRLMESKVLDSNLFLQSTHEGVKEVLKMAEYLSPKYNVVVANPPYMNVSGMNPGLKRWLSRSFPRSKSDAMTAFMERASELVLAKGFWSVINLPAWMFNKSNSKLRDWLIANCQIESLVYFGRGVFGSDFGSVAIVVCKKRASLTQRTVFRKLFENHVDVRSNLKIENIFQDRGYGRFSFNQHELKAIPGSPFAFWSSDKVREAFNKYMPISESGIAASGIQTSNNDKYLRFWHEVNSNTVFDQSEGFHEIHEPSAWVPHNKGGAFRRWYGNQDYVLAWHQSGHEAKIDPKFQKKNMKYQMKEAATWSHTSSGTFSVRYSQPGRSFNVEGPVYIHDSDLHFGVGFLASKVALYMMNLLNPTLHFLVGSVQLLPICNPLVVSTVKSAIAYGKSDWDAYENSREFTTLPLLEQEYRAQNLEDTYESINAHWRETTKRMQKLEEENNQIFIEAYSLQNELNSSVPLSEITLTCNPAYRYGRSNTVEELDNKLRTDTMREFLHYAVGCMLGRYSLEAPGLILANQGETIKEYMRRVPNPSFEPDDDNIIPVLDGNWFSDDIVERFKVFLRTTFGAENYAENLAYIEASIGKKIRPWFLKDFYAYHVRRYKKRPIYWMISSPKGSFNVLFYMHRYRPELFSQVLEDYLRPFQSKLEGHLGDLNRIMNDSSASALEIKTATKEIDNIRATQRELQDWERDVLYPLAGKRLPLDLDDGVKVNYPRFAPALKKIPGL